MAQYTPKTWTTGETITAAELNAIEQAAAAAAVKTDADAAYDAKGAATAAQAAAVQRANHTGTQSADTLTDGTTNKAFLATERTKLTGVATGATANSTDAQLRDRSTHTGTQAATTVTGLSTVATSGAYADLTGKPAIPTPTVLTPTATKAAAYTAAVGELAMMNVAGGAVALTLPTAPADKAQVGYRAVGATSAVPLVVNAGGSDTIGTTGATSATVPLADETLIYQYDAANTRWLAIANVKTKASLDSGYGLNAVRQHSIRALGVPVTTGGAGVSKQASSSASTTGYTYRVTCQTAVACTDIRLLFPWGWTLSSTTGDVLQTSAIPFKVSIELTNGTTFPVTFGGARSVNMDPGGYLISDPIAVDLPAGTLFAVRYFFNVTTGALYTQGIGGPPMSTATALNATPTMQILGAGSGRDGFSTSDVTDSGALVGSTYTGAGPPVVLGQVAGPAKPTLIGIGDSITAGTGDSGTGASQYSWFTRGASALPCIRYCVSGITVSTILANHLYSGGLLGLASDAVIMLGVNDLFAGATAATLQSSLTSLYQMAVNRGLRVWGCTILPRTTSTDSWATTANQTPVAAVNGARQTVNAWIRAGGGGLLSGYFETADTVESARDSGLWKANGTANAYTIDGTHPSPLGHSLVAAPLYNFTFPAL